MENAFKAAMVSVSVGWSDVGSWASLHGVRKKDHLSHSVRGRVELFYCSNVLVETLST